MSGLWVWHPGSATGWKSRLTSPLGIKRASKQIYIDVLPVIFKRGEHGLGAAREAGVAGGDLLVAAT